MSIDRIDMEKKRKNKEVSLVTGANGRFGRVLIKELIGKGHTVRALVLDKSMTVELPTGVIPYVGDITDRNVVNSACKGADNVFHLAAIVSQHHQYAHEIVRVNAEGTHTILDGCEKNGVSHFLFTSSVDVYGIKRKETLTEDSGLDPKDKYGYSKALAEEAILEHDAIPYTIFRMATVYGSGFENSFFKMFKALKKQKIFFIGKGTNHLALVHIDDAIDAMMLAVKNDKSRKRIYNLTDGNHYTQEYLLNMAADMLRVPRPTSHVSEFMVKLIAKSRNLDSDELRFLMSDRRISIDRIRDEIGFEPKVSIEQGGKEMVSEFLRKEE